MNIQTHTDSKMKLSNEELGKGYMLACQSSANEDLLIDIPKESMLTVEGKIATGKSKDLLALLNTIGAKIDPLTEKKNTLFRKWKYRFNTKLRFHYHGKNKEWIS